MVHTGSVRSLARLHEDLLRVAAFTGAPASETVIRRVLERFEDGFRNQSIQIRSTTKAPPRRELSFRYLDLVSGEHPLDRALATGEIEMTGHPVASWMQEVGERFPALGYGVDFEATRGLAKIWQFLAKACAPEALLDLPELPSSYRASLPLIRQLGLDEVTIVGADYAQGSINVYWRPSRLSHRNGSLLRSACSGLGFPAPTTAACEHAASAGCIAFTYRWDNPGIERICFYVPKFTRSSVPDHHPHLRAYATMAPSLVPDPQFILGWSHGHGANYLKIEDDYTGDVTGVFASAMQVPFDLEEVRRRGVTGVTGGTEVTGSADWARPSR